MRAVDTAVRGVFIIETDPRIDERGFFARAFCAREFQNCGLEHEFVQSNYSGSLRKYTLRGLHYQLGSAAESKLVRAVRGRILDVALDIRRDSPTFGRHVSVELTADNFLALYVPRGCAHGFLSLEDDSRVFYQVSNYYDPAQERGVRWNDPQFDIPWPVTEPIVSAKDATFPDFAEWR